MPEFISALEPDSRDQVLALAEALASDRFNVSTISETVCGYIEALDFTDRPDGETETEAWDSAEIARETFVRIAVDCLGFLYRVGCYLPDAVDYARVGRDLHYSRSGCGVGFFDRPAGMYTRDGHDYRDMLQRAAEGMGRVDSYVGDDGRIYLS